MMSYIETNVEELHSHTFTNTQNENNLEWHFRKSQILVLVILIEKEVNAIRKGYRRICQ